MTGNDPPLGIQGIEQPVSIADDVEQRYSSIASGRSVWP
jgi:hypothetical protein